MISTAHALNLVIILFVICFIFLVIEAIENDLLKENLTQMESSRNRWRQLALKENKQPMITTKEVEGNE